MVLKANQRTLAFVGRSQTACPVAQQGASSHNQMAGPSTLPHDKLAFCGFPLLRFQIWPCLCDSCEPRLLFLFNLDGTNERMSSFLCNLEAWRLNTLLMGIYTYVISGHWGHYFTNKYIRLYWIDPQWEPLSLTHFSHGALGTACPSEVMRVSQWGRDNVLARAAILPGARSRSVAVQSQSRVIVSFSIM